MPADISESTPAETYKDLLHLNNSGNGADTTLRALYDGDGNATPLQLSTNPLFAPLFSYPASSTTSTPHSMLFPLCGCWIVEC